MPAAAAAVHTRSRGAIGLDGSNADGMDGGKGSIGDGGPVGGVACAGGNWMSSLRNANERLLQVGTRRSGGAGVREGENLTGKGRGCSTVFPCVSNFRRLRHFHTLPADAQLFAAVDCRHR